MFGSETYGLGLVGCLLLRNVQLSLIAALFSDLCYSNPQSRRSSVTSVFLPLGAFGMIRTAETQVGVTTNKLIQWGNRSSVCTGTFIKVGGRRVTADNLALQNTVLVVFLSTQKIRALSNPFSFLLSVIWAQQILVICCWPVHVL